MPAYDEDDEPDLFDPCEAADIDEEDYVISDSGPCGSRCSVRIQGGRFLGEFPDEDAAERAIRADMERSQFWPSVWYVNDHGNVFAR